ncbi:uncharacterized protein At4g13200, chloroplastic [Nicotiana tomentosiformis]|uniref:uncharacterized protein At4g13200, chloroplastic n=1 Tax=Nicotiana tomentosiformis TaxID=4098 RepID=UPI00051C84A9|nr:uncharacterized protein At4g13200, chloroplastic [Nicotiana tomentosiformis]
MSRVVPASLSSSLLYSSPTQSKPPRLQRWNSSALLFPTTHPFSSLNIKLTTSAKSVTAHSFTCNCSSTPGGPSPGENESKNILDAFFLGKALAEAVTERIESTVGEFLSTVGRLQAEQQKQVQDFQEEVLERAKQAKEKAARETMDTQGLIPNSFAADTSTAGTSVNSATSPQTSINSQPAKIDSEDGSKDSKLGLSNGD